jgi:hypothetical protein
MTFGIAALDCERLAADSSLVRQWDEPKARIAGNAVTEAEVKAGMVAQRKAAEMAKLNRDQQTESAGCRPITGLWSRRGWSGRWT